MKILGFITTVFLLIYLFVNRNMPIILNLANGTFIIGLIYFLIALIFYVRNVGFFKLISYHKYRKKQLKTVSNHEDILEFHEFCKEHYKEKWSNKEFFVFGISLLILSYVLAYFA